MNLSEFKSSTHRDRSLTYSRQESLHNKTSRSGSHSSDMIESEYNINPSREMARLHKVHRSSNSLIYSVSSYRKQKKNRPRHMSLIKKAFREFGSKEVEIDCLSVSDASEKSEEKDNSAATER